MEKHNYKIVLNRETSDNLQEYHFGLRNTLVRIYCREQAATIEYEDTGELKTSQKLLDFSEKIFRDAFRKAYLLHALNFSEGLKVRKICIYIDGNKDKELTRKNASSIYPYMFSMIPEIDLGLPDSWTKLGKYVANITKTKLEKDKRYTAMYAFLSSKGREYEIDKFLYCWTAMNAYYDYITECYKENVLQDGNFEEPKKWDNIAAIKESDRIGAMAWQIDGKYKNVTRSEAEKIWARGPIIGYVLKDITWDNVHQLYDCCRYGGSDNDVILEKAEKIQKKADDCGVGLYSFMLLIYPYYLRCSFFHGNITTALVSAYNDWEIGALRTVNYFMERFLNEEIPNMFCDDFWNCEKQEKYVGFVKEMYGEKNMKKQLNKLKKKSEEGNDQAK